MCRWLGIGLVGSSGHQRPGPDDLPKDVAFLPKPYFSRTVIGVILQMTTPKVFEPTSAGTS